MSTDLTATPIERDVVIVSGADAFEYLQTQLTQDVVSLSRGASAWSFILTPKSEIEALVRVTAGSEGVIIDVASGYGAAVRGRLDGLLFRLDVSFEEATWPGVAWRGGGAASIESDAPVTAALPWPGVEALDEVGPGIAAPSGVARFSDDELEAVRIRAGWPGEPEIDGSVTPAMTGIVEHTVSFTKGCYTGQEFVARVHHRDAPPPRRLVRLSFEPGTRIGPGSVIDLGSDAVGTTTSVVSKTGTGLAYLKRSVEVPCDASVGGLRVSLEPIR